MTMPADIPALAVIVVRDGELPAGADETVAEAGGAALVLGSGTREAAGLLDAASRVWLLERSSVAPGAVAAALAQVLSGVPMVLLPASPDGRDLAPRLAVVLGRALLAGAVRCAPDEVELTRLDDRLSLRVAVDGPVVVTLRPGFRGTPERVTLAEVTALEVPEDGTRARRREHRGAAAGAEHGGPGRGPPDPGWRRRAGARRRGRRGRDAAAGAGGGRARRRAPALPGS